MELAFLFSHQTLIDRQMAVVLMCKTYWAIEESNDQHDFGKHQGPATPRILKPTVHPNDPTGTSTPRNVFTPSQYM